MSEHRVAGSARAGAGAESGADIASLIEAARTGSPRAVARLISLVEDATPAVREVLARLAPRGARAWVVGLTGPPGVGKSTATSRIVGRLRAEGLRVAVIAVDPSSPFTGGALLGDRVRMQEHTSDPGVYIRSLASRGHLGGLSLATPQVVRVLDGVGFDVVLIETVGVGQSEVEIAALADTTVVIVAPGLGDGIQAAKAGILEIGDVFVVNKADRDGAPSALRDLRHMIELGRATAGATARATVGNAAWNPPVLSLVASTGVGIDELVTALKGHRSFTSESGDLARRRLRRAVGEIEGIVLEALRRRIGGVERGDNLDRLAQQVVEGLSDPYSAADRLLAGLEGGSVSGTG